MFYYTCPSKDKSKQGTEGSCINRTITLSQLNCQFGNCNFSRTKNHIKTGYNSIWSIYGEKTPEMRYHWTAVELPKRASLVLRCKHPFEIMKTMRFWVFMHATVHSLYLLEVLRGQVIKPSQVVPTSEYYEHWWNNHVFFKILFLQGLRSTNIK